VMTLPLLECTDGIQKMSKSYNNYIGVDDSPSDMFGKVMSISDGLMWKYYELLSSRSLGEIQDLKDRVSRGSQHPMEAKMNLAQEIVERYHGKYEADLARESFVKVFKEKSLPEDMPDVTLALERPWIGSVLKEAGLVGSTSEAKRLVAQGAVSIDDEKVTDSDLVLTKGTFVIKVGKRRFARVTIS
jgi:tyrosyl-tRNA synthetase